jgi:hypothetical protein
VIESYALRGLRARAHRSRNWQVGPANYSASPSTPLTHRPTHSTAKLAAKRQDLLMPDQ